MVGYWPGRKRSRSRSPGFGPSRISDRGGRYPDDRYLSGPPVDRWPQDPPPDRWKRARYSPPRQTRGTVAPPPRSDSSRRFEHRPQTSPPGAHNYQRPQAPWPGKAAPSPSKKTALHKEATDELPALSSIHKGTVTFIKPFGVFVELPGHRLHGLVPAHMVADSIRFGAEDSEEMREKALDFLVPIGSEAWVKVVSFKEKGRGNRVFACSMKAVSQEDGTDLEPSGQNDLRTPDNADLGTPKDGAPALGTILKGRVHAIKPFGIFVAFDGWRNHALVHHRQVSDHLDIARDDSDEAKVSALEAVVAVGEAFWVKVVEVQAPEAPQGRPKIACSIKLVSQQDGRDLDPQGLSYQSASQRGGPAGGTIPLGSTAGAIQKDGRVEWGHLSAGDHQFGDADRHYDLLPDNDELAMPVGQMPVASAAGPMGRGRSVVQPAWMTQGIPNSQSAAAANPSAGDDAHFKSLEDAEKFLREYDQDRKDKKTHKRHKKEKDKDKDKDKPKKEKKESKSKHK